MSSKTLVFLLFLTVVSTIRAAVTNEDIRTAILQIVNMVRSTDDKLERHEYRDRVVGEQLKKGMINIDKRIKMLDPLKGTVGRLDERLAAVETILMQKNEREKMQLQRTYEAVIDIQKNLPVIMEGLKNDIISKLATHEPPAQIIEPLMSKKDFEKMEKEFVGKIDKVTNTISKIESELGKIKDKDSNNKSNDVLEKLKQHINDNQKFLTNYDKKLAALNNKIPERSNKESKDQEEFKQNVLKALDNEKSNIKEILKDLKNMQNKSPFNGSQPQNEELRRTIHNLNNSNGDILKNINGLTELTGVLIKSVANANNAMDGQKINVKEILQSVKDIQQKNSLFTDDIRRAVNAINYNVNGSLDDTMKNINGLTEMTGILIKSVSNANNALENQRANLQEILQELRNTSRAKNGVQARTLDEIQRAVSTITDNINHGHQEAMKNLNGLTEISAVLVKSVANANNVLDAQKGNVNEILHDVKNLHNKVNQLPRKEELIPPQQQNTAASEDLRRAIDNMNNNLNITHDDTMRNINGLTSIAATLVNSISNANNVLDGQKSEVKNILQYVQNLQEKVNQLPQKDDLSLVQRATLKRLDEIENNRNPSDEEMRRTLKDSLKNLTEIARNTAISSSVGNSNFNEIVSDLRNLQNRVNQLPQKYDLALLQNQTSKKLEDLSNKINILNQVQTSLNEVNNNLNKTHDDTMRNLNDLSEITGTLAENFATNYGNIKSELHALSKIDQVIIKTSDDVVDIKRRLEYGVHQIMGEVGKQLKESSKNINQGISDRFDRFETNILDEETGALANLTSKIGEDIHQVWRQIGIMYQQISSSADALNHLQNMTDTYVNGSLGAINNMKGRVGQINGRMQEVDENLNYLLGRLSLVTQEFNQIKTGLGTALDQIRDSFRAVQDKVNNTGPGPHPIPPNEALP